MITLVKFGAKWCQPCKRYDPILKTLEESRDDVEVTHIDIEENPQEATKYGIKSVPFTILLEDAEILGGFQGVKTLKQLNKVIDEQIGRDPNA